MKFGTKLILSTIAILIVDHFVSSMSVSNFLVAFITAFVLTLINKVVRPILVLLTLPATFISLGLFLFVINGFTLFITSKIVPGFEIHGVWACILTSIFISIVQSILGSIVDTNKKKNLS